MPSHDHENLRRRPGDAAPSALITVAVGGRSVRARPRRQLDPRRRKTVRERSFRATVAANSRPGTTRGHPTDTVLVVDPAAEARTRWGELARLMDRRIRVEPYARGALLYARRAPVGVSIVRLDAARYNGADICRQLRDATSAPVIAVLNREHAPAVEAALQCGADDVLVEPLQPEAVRLRLLVAVARRLAGAGEGLSTLRLGDLELDTSSRRVRLAGEEAELTPTQYQILYVLATNAGRVVQHEELLRRVWGVEYASDTQLLWVQMCHLRRKLERDPNRPKLLRTVPRVGYILGAATGGP